jgi:protocatechuate 3,4-dioxygenase beta subunit
MRTVPRAAHAARRFLATIAASSPAMSKRTFVLAVGLVALVALVLFFVTRNGSEEHAPEDGAGGPDAAEERRALIERKRSAREGRTLELEAPRVVTGLVSREADGVGVPGAVVLLTRKAVTQGGTSEPGEPPVPLHVVTDDAGEFTLTNVPPGRYVVSATARGYLPAQRNDVRILPGRDDERITLSLLPGGHALSGTVTDIGGGPIENVLVSVNDMESGNLFGVRFAPPAALTDDEGHYEIALPNGSYVLTTYHPDYVASYRLTQLMDGPRVEDVVLSPGAVIEGVVLGRASNRAVADAIVTFQDGRNGSSSGGFRVNVSADGRMVRTDEDGRFRLEGVHPGVAQLEARGSGGASRETVAVPVGIGETVTGVELVLDEAFTVSGFVVPKDDPERAVEGVMVGAYSMSPPSLTVAVAPTDADGYFEILGVLPGNYTVGAIGEELLPNISGASAIVHDRDVTDVLVKMDVGHRIRGRVEPPVPAKVSLSLDMGQMSLGKVLDAIAAAFARTTADARGQFDLGPVSDGDYTLVAEAPDGDHAELDVTVAGTDLEGITLTLQPRASVEGTVVDETGEPQRGMTVGLTKIGGGGFDLGAMMRGPFGAGAVPTQEDGTFVARGLDEGEYSVVVRDHKARPIPWVDDGDSTEPSPFVVKVPRGERVTGLVLRVQSRTGVLSGRVVDADGAPVADAWVTASLQLTAQEFGTMMAGPDVPDPDQRKRVRGVFPPGDAAEAFELPGFFAEQPVLTDENGRFTVAQLRPSRRYTVVAEGDKGGARGRLRDLAPSRSDLVIRLEAIAGIAGVVTAGGKTVAQYTVAIAGPSNRQTSVFSKAGAFRIERIEPGEYTVTVTSDAGVARREKVEVQAAQTTDLRIELDDYGTIEGKLVDAATGAPIAGMVVFVQPAKGDGDPSQALAMLTGGGTKTDRDGAFEVSKVAPGEGTVTFLDTTAAFSGGGRVATAGYEIEPGQTLDLGTINGIPSAPAGEGERGKYGLGVTVATHQKRPRPPGTKLDEPTPDDDDADSSPRLWVSYVEVGGPADEEGIRPGDEVVAVDGRSVASLGPHTASILIEGAQVKVGDRVAVDFEREGSTRTATLEAEAKKAKKKSPEQ